MLKEERFDIILRELNGKKKVLSTELSSLLEVSEDTIRRDLNELADKKLLRKVHGGALPYFFNPSSYEKRKELALDKKYRIARKTFELFKEDQIILTDGGTTNLEALRQLPLDFCMTLFTNSLPIAELLSDYKNIETYFIGGRLFKESRATVGTETLNWLSNIHADLCLIGVCSLSLEHGVTAPDWEESRVKKAMIESSREVAALVISDKIQTEDAYKFGDITDIDYLITELDESEEILLPYRNIGLHIL